MATKSRNTNAFTKFICVLLSVLLFGVSAFSVISLVKVGTYTDNIEEQLQQTGGKQLDGCDMLVMNLERDLGSISYNLKLENKEAIQAALLEKKDDFKADIIRQLNRFRNNYSVDSEDEDEAYAEEGNELETTTLYYGGEKFEYNYKFKNINGIDFQLDAAEFWDTDKEIMPGDTDEAVDAKLEILFNEVYNNYRSYQDYYSVTGTDLVYYAVDKANNITLNSEAKPFDYENVTENEIYALSIVDGKVNTSSQFYGIIGTKTDDGYSYDFGENCDVYLYVDDAQNGDYMRIITSYYDVDSINVKLYIIIAAAALLCALILMIKYFTVAGVTGEDGYVKRAFIDYIPSDLHLVLGLGLAALSAYGMVVSAAYFIDGYTSVPYMLLLAACALAGICWGIIIEIISSIIRVSKSSKRFSQNLLVVNIFKYGITRPIKSVFKKLKAFFAYKPENFKKTLTKWLVLYNTVNLMFFFIVLFAAGDDEPYIAVFFTALALGCNASLFSYVVWYGVQLDKIIQAAKTKTVPVVNYPKLPNSLKILVNSLQYTRQELNNAVNKAVRDERMRTELITNVSHDLKTPLTSIINYVDLLKTCDIQDENAREYIEVLDEKGGRLKRLIEDLIEASKITSGVITLNPVNLSLSELAAQAVYERQQEFSENGLELVFKGEHGNVNAFADGNKTFRVIENLLSNARKYSAVGSRVYCDVYETQNFSIFEIKNISAEPLDITPQELKERFVRGDKSRNNEGNGLGLSIADNLCTAQGGHLNLTIDGDLFKAQVMLPKATLTPINKTN